MTSPSSEMDSGCPPWMPSALRICAGTTPRPASSTGTRAVTGRLTGSTDTGRAHEQAHGPRGLRSRAGIQLGSRRARCNVIRERFAGLLEVMVRLETEPKLRRHAEVQPQTNCSVRGDASNSFNDLIGAPCGHADVLCECRYWLTPGGAMHYSRRISRG